MSRLALSLQLPESTQGAAHSEAHGPVRLEAVCWKMVPEEGVRGLNVQVVLAGTKPPPSIASRSCVYVVKRSDGMFYCGQSDNLASEHSAARTCILSEALLAPLSPSTAALCMLFLSQFTKSIRWWAVSSHSCNMPM